MQYIDRIGTIAPTEPDNALLIGQALHKGLETDAETAIAEYYASFPIIGDEHINEAIKLEYLIPKVKELLPSGQCEVELNNADFHGFIDLLAPSTIFRRGVEVPNAFDIYDYKYSNNIDHYMESTQLHLYKYFFEKLNPGKYIKNMYFVFVPKVNIKQKKSEDITSFRFRILNELEHKQIKIKSVEYQPDKVIDWLFQIKQIQEEMNFEKMPSFLCRYCEYEDYCMKGNDYMLLPKNERRNIEKVNKRVLWIYGVPFCGKTTFANAFPEPLMLNTDGNIKFVDAPYIHIKDEVTVEGRITKRKLAWEIFKDAVTELEKKDNTFKTIVIDLLEDLYEHCRVYMCNQMGISHESDDSFKAWDKVRTEFLNTLKRLVNLEYENIILISHEDTTKDITKKGGDKVTAIKPNLSDKVAVKVAGMVDVVARIVADGDVRTFNFKSNEVIFGGGRLKVNAKDIPLDVDALFKVYDEANKNASSVATGQASKQTPATDIATDKNASNEATDAPKAQRRRRSATPDSDNDTASTVEDTIVEEAPAVTDETSEPTDETKPVRRTRKQRNA